MSTFSISKNNNVSSQSLNQGKKYIKYQDKVKKQTKLNELSCSSGSFGSFGSSDFYVKEGFSLTNNQDNLTKESNKIINQNENQSHTLTLNNLRTEYDKTLYEYEQLQSSVSQKTNQYIDRVNPSNPYLNKTIRFTTGDTAYVTNQGVVKYMPTREIWNSCGAPQDFIQLDIPWNDEWKNALGKQLSTNPPLIIGTVMKLGQSIGNEGLNVYVNDIITNPQITYTGCYADDTSAPNMKFLGEKPMTEENIIIKNGDFVKPELSNNSYKYYKKDYTSVPNWYFDAVLLNNSDAWGFPMPFPSGNQCVCLQAKQSISQTVTLNSGVEYTLSFLACGRNCCDDSGLSNEINVIVSNTDNTNPLTIYNVQPEVSSWLNYSTTFTVQNNQKYLLIFSGTWPMSSGDRSTALQKIQVSATTSSTGSYSYASCKQSAIDQGYRYFSLQNVNTTTSQGFCAVSNSLPSATSLGESYTPSGEIVLWSSNTSGQPGNYAELSQNGSLSVINSEGQTVFTTDNSKATPGNYMGCYGDSEKRAIPMANEDGSLSTKSGGDNWSFDYDTSLHYARKNSFTYFSTQATKKNGTNGEAGFTNDLNHAMKYGKASNCIIDPDGYPAGQAWSNAIYSTDNTSHYYVILEDNGNMSVFRGSSPNDNQGEIWSSMTKGQEKSSNPNYAAKNGKYGNNWMPQGSVLMSGDFIGSNDGKITLIMQTDGNLVLYTFKKELNCKKMTDGNIGGGVSANALYDIGKVGIPGNVGKLAYIDQNSSIFNYNSTQLSNTFNVVKQKDIIGNDIPGSSFGDATVSSCKETCVKNPDCAGFTFQTKTKICSPKTNVMSNREKNEEVELYSRHIIPLDAPLGIPDKTTNIDSVTFQRYLNGGSFSNAYGLSEITSVQKSKLDQLESRLNQLSSQINTYTDKFGIGSQDAEKQMNKNENGLNHYLTDLQKTKGKIDHFNTNMDNILNDSDITALQKNYEYLFWSILAVGTVMITMNVVKKYG
jgi:hypothetical protein